ncbi:MAG: hypothetical protein P8X42_18590 [Calditrichaceae bacterium]
MNHINNYLGVEQVRLGNRLKLKFNISEDALKMQILPFVLLPLIENAVKHGIQDQILGGTIYLDIQNEMEYLRIMVRNSFEQKTTDKNRQGNGLQTLQQRLDAMYKGRASFKTSRQNGEFIVNMLLPVSIDTKSIPESNSSSE